MKLTICKHKLSNEWMNDINYANILMKKSRNEVMNFAISTYNFNEEMEKGGRYAHTN